MTRKIKNKTKINKKDALVNHLSRYNGKLMDSIRLHESKVSILKAEMSRVSRAIVQLRKD